MISAVYRAQVDLLLQVLPHVATEACFALKGGTAINLFVRDLPRLSVDIDLTYLPFHNRDQALAEITESLGRIKNRIEKALPAVRVTPVQQSDGQHAKLSCQSPSAQIKIEVNTTLRGTIAPGRLMQVSESVQEEFGKFAAINVVSHAELFGGKICAALDRQHPRDLFDIYYLLENEGLSDDLRLGFITCLISSPRPINEMLNPRLQDQESAYQSQFAGMTMLPFSYGDYLSTRERLIHEVSTWLSEADRQFLISFKRGNPHWELVALSALRDLPAVQWKLKNIQRLAEKDPTKHAQQLERLEAKLFRQG